MSEAILAEIRNKSDKILNSVDNLTIRLDDLDIKFDNLNARLTILEQSVNSKFQELESVLSDRVNCSSLKIFLERLNRLEHIDLEKQDIVVMKESYDRRLNVLIHGLRETNHSTREEAEETQQTFRKLMQDDL